MLFNFGNLVFTAEQSVAIFSARSRLVRRVWVWTKVKVGHIGGLTLARYEPCLTILWVSSAQIGASDKTARGLLDVGFRHLGECVVKIPAKCKVEVEISRSRASALAVDGKSSGLRVPPRRHVVRDGSCSGLSLLVLYAQDPLSPN